MDATNPETMRCPTCRAVQAWSDACRRCRCDLRLLRETAEEVESLRRQCLVHLQLRQLPAALDRARRGYDLRPDSTARRLLAVCELLSGHWESARELGLQGVVDEPTGDRP